MKWRHVAAWFCGVVLLGTGATFLQAQAPQPANQGAAQGGRARLRAEIIKLRTDVEMLRLDYELARDDLKEDLKLRKGLKMAGGFMQLGASIQSAINQAGEPPAAGNPAQEQERKRKQTAEAAKAAKEAEEEEKKDAAEQSAFIAERKKELRRLYTLLAEKRLDLEDAKRSYRAITR